MKNFNKLILFVLALVICLPIFTMAQNNDSNQKDSDLIKQTALYYVDGYYSGDVVRMEKAIHPDLNKAAPRDIYQTGRTSLNYTTYSGLVEGTRAKTGLLADTARHIEIKILNIDNNIANVKITSANFIDYVQTIKLDEEWKIVNVLFTSGTTPRLKDFKPEKEKSAIEQTALNYLKGITGADAKRVELSVDPDFNKIILNPIAATGKMSFRRQRYTSIIENAIAGYGKQDEIYKNNRVIVLDITDGLAIVKCEMATICEYIQMFKSGNEWKVLNSITDQTTKITLAEAMTVIAGNPMTQFSLPIYGGGQFELSKYHGKNVMLLFPRGWVGNSWCTYCPYQYLELEQLEKDLKIRKKYNLEIAAVMPYSNDKVKDWIEKFPANMKSLENLKNPAKPAAKGSIQAEYTLWVNKNFPIKFEPKQDDTHNIIPVLVDENRTLSRQLKIFTNFWDGVSSEQNMASIFIIDKNGILQFKYIGQMTEDRPSIDYLLDYIKNMK